MNAYPIWPIRKQQCLDGVWDFAWLGGETALADFQPGTVRFQEKIAVPGVFDMGVDRYMQRGLGVYRLLVSGCSEPRLRLAVAGMGLAARLFWDGREIGKYTMPYSAEEYDFTSSDENEHELIIALDNRFEAQEFQFFREGYDFYAFGGIYRSITLQALPENRIERLQVFPLELESGKVKLRLILGGKIPDRLNFALSFDGKTPKKYTRKVVNGIVELTTSVPDRRIWSPESPNLHTIEAATADDAMIERFGLRTVETRNGRILLNGKEIYLNGVNRHETHPEFGPVQSCQSMLEDIRLIRNAGMNFIRCVHYPQDQAWLDLCDETGMLVWVESLGWGLTDPADHSDRTLPYFLAQNRSMIRHGVNHASVIFWGMLNECASHLETSRNFYAALLRDMKKEDPTRLRSYASCRNVYDVCFDQADVISMNCYPGWFADITDSHTLASELIPPHLKQIADFYSQQKFGGKPILITEIGACGVYGVRDRNLAQWTEDFQADFMRKSVRAIHKNPAFSGYALWQFCDSRSYQRGQIRGKPFGFNLAGLVDPYRRMKLAYDEVREEILARAERTRKKRQKSDGAS